MKLSLIRFYFCLLHVLCFNTTNVPFWFHYFLLTGRISYHPVKSFYSLCLPKKCKQKIWNQEEGLLNISFCLNTRYLYQRGRIGYHLVKSFYSLCLPKCVSRECCVVLCLNAKSSNTNAPNHGQSLQLFMEKERRNPNLCLTQ